MHLLLAILSYFLIGLGSGIIGASVALYLQRRERTPSHPVSQLVTGLSKINPLSGRERGQPLPIYQLPKGIDADVIGDQVVLTDSEGRQLIVGDNDHGGFGFKTVHAHRWTANYATMQDAMRAAAREGFKA